MENRIKDMIITAGISIKKGSSKGDSILKAAHETTKLKTAKINSGMV